VGPVGDVDFQQSVNHHFCYCLGLCYRTHVTS
jgi:hypothetical protein